MKSKVVNIVCRWAYFFFLLIWLVSFEQPVFFFICTDTYFFSSSSLCSSIIFELMLNDVYTVSVSEESQEKETYKFISDAQITHRCEYNICCLFRCCYFKLILMPMKNSSSRSSLNRREKKKTHPIHMSLHDS